MLPLRYPCKSKITLQSKFQPNRTSGSRDIAIFFKIWPKFGPSFGTLWPIPKIFTMYNLPYCGGAVSKFEPSRTKTVAVVWKVRTFLASILYIYRCKSYRDDSSFYMNIENASSILTHDWPRRKLHDHIHAKDHLTIPFTIFFNGKI